MLIVDVVAIVPLEVDKYINTAYIYTHMYTAWGGAIGGIAVTILLSQAFLLILTVAPWS